MILNNQNLLNTHIIGIIVSYWKGDIVGIVVIGPTFVDIKGFPINKYIDKGRNEGTVKMVHGGVARNIVEDIANIELRPTF